MPLKDDQHQCPCAHHTDLVSEVAVLKSQLDDCRSKQKEDENKLLEQIASTAKLSGILEGTVPEIQKDIRKIYDLMGAKEETENVYYGQIRTMVNDIENAQHNLADATLQINDKMSKQTFEEFKEEIKFTIDKKASTEYVTESTKNINAYIRLGWIAVASGFLLLIIKLWLG